MHWKNHPVFDTLVPFGILYKYVVDMIASQKTCSLN